MVYLTDISRKRRCLKSGTRKSHLPRTRGRNFTRRKNGKNFVIKHSSNMGISVCVAVYPPPMEPSSKLTTSNHGTNILNSHWISTTCKSYAPHATVGNMEKMKPIGENNILGILLNTGRVLLLKYDHDTRNLSKL